MSAIKKVAVLAAVTVVAIGAGLPVISNYIADDFLNRSLSDVTENYDFSVAAIDVSSSFNETVFDVRLEGEGLRQISNETITLNGTLQHGSLFDLSSMLKGRVEYIYYFEQQGLQFGVPGELEGTVSWFGTTSADISAEGLELPLDAESGIRMSLSPTKGQLQIDGDDMQLNLEPQQWSILQGSALWFSVALQSSHLVMDKEGQSWEYQVPEITVSAQTQTQDLMTVADVAITGNQEKKDKLLTARTTVKTGQVTVPLLAHQKMDKVIEGVSMTSVMENLSEEAINELSEMMSVIDQLDNDDEIIGLFADFLQVASVSEPRIAMENLEIETAYGNLGISMGLQLTESAGLQTENIKKLPLMNERQKGETLEALLQSLNSSARIDFSDDLLTWSCQRVGQESARARNGTVAQAEMMGDMCLSMVETGEFFGAGCLQMDTEEKQSLCLKASSKAKESWVKEKSINIAIEDGKLSLNGAEIDFL